MGPKNDPILIPIDGFVNEKHLALQLFQIIFFLPETKPDILRRHLRALNEEGENSLDYDSKEANISTLETEIISHSRILALQLPEITKDLSYGGKIAFFTSLKPRQG